MPDDEAPKPPSVPRLRRRPVAAQDPPKERYPLPSVEEQVKRRPGRPRKVPEKPKLPRRSDGAMARLSKWEQFERRQQVAKLRMQGLQMAQIAKVMNLNIHTVSRDLDAVQSENKKVITDFDKQKYLGEGLARFEEIRQRTWSEYYSTDEVRYKLKALDVLRAVQRDEFSALIDTGVIVKDPEKPQQVEHEHKHTLHLDWSPEMRERVAQALLQESLRTTLAEPTLEAGVVDAVVVETVDADAGTDTKTENGPESETKE